MVVGRIQMGNWREGWQLRNANRKIAGEFKGGGERQGIFKYLQHVCIPTCPLHKHSCPLMPKNNDVAPVSSKWIHTPEGRTQFG